MKNKFLAVLLLGMVAAFSLTACGQKEKVEPSVTEESSVESTEDNEEESTEENKESTPEEFTGKEVFPLPAAFSIDDVTDVSVPAEFTFDSLKEENGVYTLAVTIYDYELFDAVDVAQLEPSDILHIDGNEVLIDTLETNPYGGIEINGGIENGGLMLSPAESGGVYYELGFSDMLSYYVVGEVTLPVSADLVFENSSDLEAGEQSLTLDDFVKYLEENEYAFQPRNTTVVVQNSEITNIIKVFVP